MSRSRVVSDRMRTGNRPRQAPPPGLGGLQQTITCDPGSAEEMITVIMPDAEGMEAERTTSFEIDNVPCEALLEFYWTVTRKPEVPIPHAVAAGLAGQLLTAHVVAPSAELALAAVERSGRDSLPIWDAFILEAAESCGAATLYTEDRHLAGAPAALSVVDPFTDLPRPDAG